jgi:HSP20 family molecular chaperone IbpA
MAIVRWDPFREFGGAWMPPVDIYSTGEHELVIKAEIPGMDREALDITVENFTLTIRGQGAASRRSQAAPDQGQRRGLTPDLGTRD